MGVTVRLERAAWRRALALGAAAVLCMAGPAMAREQAVRFAPGANSATLKGSITGDAGMDYLVPASAGQTLTVSLLPDNGHAYFNVLPPGGDSAIFIGSTLGNRFSGVVAASGTHRIRIYQMRARARRGAAAAYTLTVALGGKAGPMASADAKVAGTNYNATADVPCVLAAGAPMGRCPAGVMRMPGGEATVEIRLPAGAMRRIHFKAGRPTGHDVYKAGFSASRDGDVNIIKVGAETYRIPDAFVLGG